MNKLLCFMLVTICTISLCSCSKSANIEDIKTWDCTVTCAEKSSDNAHVR